MDFSGNELRLGDRVITTQVGTSDFIGGEVVKLTPNGAKVAIDAIVVGTKVHRASKVIQREYTVIHLVRHNPAREAELSKPKSI